MTTIGMIGGGSWGTALSVLLAENGHQVQMWSIDPQEVATMSQLREHKERLPGVILPDSIVITGDLADTVKKSEVLIMAVPSPFVRSTARNMASFVRPGQIIVDVSKGIEADTLMTLSQQIEAEIPQAEVAVLSGPSHAEEVGRRLPTTCVIGARSEAIARHLQDVFMSPYFRVYISPDIIGIEIGGSLKNVIALAAGIADGLGYGDNSKAALITRGIAEISRLGIQMGGRVETFAGLSGIGDLIVTCASVHSRNWKAGYLIGQGKTVEEAMAEVKMVVEGVYSAKAALALGEKYGVSLPIVEEINAILFQGKEPSEAVEDLMLRKSRVEHKALPWD